MPGRYIQKQTDLVLFDMVHDPYEKLNVIERYPEIAEKLLGYAEYHRNKFFGDNEN